MKSITPSLAIMAALSILFTACTKDKAGAVTSERSFYMGFTTWPYAFTDSAVQYTSEKANALGDLLAFHFDNGVPWNEALANTNYPQHILDDITAKASQVKPGHQLYVSLSALQTSRTAIALYRNTGDNQQLPSPWDTISFDNPMVASAYVNYCSFLIDQLHPIYFNYGMESNSHSWTTQGFAKYKTFCSRVYTALKAKHPSLNIMVSVMVDGDAKTFSNAAELMPYTDYVALSIYPYIYEGSAVYGDANPDDLPADWLSKMRAIAPDKKFGIAETGYIAEDLNLSNYGLTKHGTPEWQARYVSKLLAECNTLKAEFIVYWELRDYDQGWAYLQSIGLTDQALTTWKDIGLIDGDGNNRTSLTTWNEWLGKKQN
jgi:hypothetical protein